MDDIKNNSILIDSSEIWTPCDFDNVSKPSVDCMSYFKYFTI